jgi:hypothetical protein
MYVTYNSLQTCIRKFATTNISHDLSLNVAESDSEDEAVTSFLRHRLQSTRKRTKPPASKEGPSDFESEEPDAAKTTSSATTRMAPVSSTKEKTKSREREASPVTTSEEEPNIVEQSVLKTLIGEMEANLLREFINLKNVVEERQDAIENRLDKLKSDIEAKLNAGFA